MMYSTTDISQITQIDITTIRTILGLPEFEKKREPKRNKRGYNYHFTKLDFDNLKRIVQSRRKWKKLRKENKVNCTECKFYQNEKCSCKEAQDYDDYVNEYIVCVKFKPKEETATNEQ